MNTGFKFINIEEIQSTGTAGNIMWTLFQDIRGPNFQSLLGSRCINANASCCDKLGSRRSEDILNNHRGKQGHGVILLYDRQFPPSLCQNKTGAHHQTRVGSTTFPHTHQFQNFVTSECLAHSRQHHEQQKIFFFAKAIQKLAQYWNKCVDVKGDYYEKYPTHIWN
jgi:hypothetical protein